METKSLYDRLGGGNAVALVVDEFINRAAVNPKVNFSRDGKYADVDVYAHKKILSDFIAMATGGPSKYDGRDMTEAHSGMSITDSEYDALAADLLSALNKFNVPDREKSELLNLVESVRSKIVRK